MTPDDARSSLDDIRRLQDRTHEEHFRHGFSRPYVVGSALALFVAFASFDLPGPWDTTAVAVGLGTILGLLVACRRRALVHRRPTGSELLFYAVMTAGLIVAYVVFAVLAAIATLAFDLPAPHTVAAAALALTILLCMGPAQRVLTSLVRR